MLLSTHTFFPALSRWFSVVSFSLQPSCLFKHALALFSLALHPSVGCGFAQFYVKCQLIFNIMAAHNNGPQLDTSNKPHVLPNKQH